ncbi:dihydrouridine synthase [Chitinispirillum alkaliphilum]|nr:dihydrouridine synthase [Chitinispirillum alkaliphilum]
MQETPLTQHQFYLAPLRGITDHIFRTVFERHFGKFDYLMAPFISTTKGKNVRASHFRDLLPENNDTKRTIPQIIGNDSEGFLLLCQKLHDLGYESVNWNLGCPSPLITKKKRGSGLLPHLNHIETFLDEVIPKLPLSLSIKTRLGLESPKELDALIPVFNRFPLKEIIIHPRTGKQLYEGNVDTEAFSRCYLTSKHELIFNGDILSADDLRFLSTTFPNIRSWMIGRGVLRFPFILETLKQNKTELSVKRINNFHDEIFYCNSIRLPEFNLLGRMKELWKYLCFCFIEGEYFLEDILRTDNIHTYNEKTVLFFDSQAQINEFPSANLCISNS